MFYGLFLYLLSNLNFFLEKLPILNSLSTNDL